MYKLKYLIILLCMLNSYSHACSLDDIREIVINSCNLIEKSSNISFKKPFDYISCCDTHDSNIVQLCARFFCH
jgi:hypothetical protein